MGTWQVKIIIMIMLSIGVFFQSVDARERSQKARDNFKYSNPCPSNGNNHGACPGYVIDHITALACGGIDSASNMQWQTVKAGKAKDKWERKGCNVRNPGNSTGLIGNAYHTGKRGGCFAEQIKSGFIEEARKAWRKEAAAREFEKTQGYQQQAKQLQDAEPKKPLIFGVNDWQIEHRVWSGKVANAKNGAMYSEMRAQDTLAGKLDNDSDQACVWDKQAQERLEKEYPLLAQAVNEKRLAEQQETAGLDKALSAFKAHALKREMKAFGYGETGKQWNAIPEKLRTMIEGFNELPKEVRTVVLDRLRENWKRSR